MNTTTRRNTFMMIATDMSQRMRSALESGVVIAIIMLLTALAVGRAESFITRVQTSEAIVLNSSVRYDLVTYRASHGHWPASAGATSSSLLNNAERAGRYVVGSDLGPDGSVTFIFGNRSGSASRLHKKRLTFRPGLVTGDAGSPISWYCGGRRPPPGIAIRGDNQTDIAPDNLMKDCRQD
jgi:type II secretory pathway pseudopilin PulG